MSYFGLRSRCALGSWTQRRRSRGVFGAFDFHFTDFLSTMSDSAAAQEAHAAPSVAPSAAPPAPPPGLAAAEESAQQEMQSAAGELAHPAPSPGRRGLRLPHNLLR